MINLHLYMLQRISALIMVPLVIGHIAVMIYAVQGGLSAEEILGRTQGSFIWAGFYGLFVVAVAVHAAIGLRAVLHEWAGVTGRALSAMSVGVGVILLALGLQAVYSVTAVIS